MEEELTEAELQRGFAEAVRDAKIFPVAVGSATRLLGVDLLLDLLALAPVAGGRAAGDRAHRPTAPKSSSPCDPDKPAAAFVFKTRRRPVQRPHQHLPRLPGHRRQRQQPDACARDGHKERLGALLKQQGKETKPRSTSSAPATSAPSPSSRTSSPATRCRPTGQRAFAPIEYPAPLMSFAVKAKTKGDEDKVISALRRLVRRGPHDARAARRRRPAR